MRDGAQVNIDLTGGWGGSASIISWRRVSGPSRWCSRAPRASAPGTDSSRFLNLRAEMLWKLREALDPQHGDGIALPPDKRLAAQLAAPTWRLRGNAIVIESKEDICKRLGTSTDDADAVMLAWHKRDRGAAAAERRTAQGRTRTGSRRMDGSMR